MASRGIWQLQKLIVRYCDFQGGSRGCRDFVQNLLPEFKLNNPHVEVVAETGRGRDPFIKGIYLNRNERVIGVRNLDTEDIMLHATRLRNSTGRKVLKLKTRHVTRQPSIQGSWDVNLKLSENPSQIINELSSR